MLTTSCSGKEFYFRFNQEGFLPGDIKTAVILSQDDLSGSEYKIINENGPVFKNEVKESLGKFGNFNFSYKINFSDVKHPGKYRILLDDRYSDFFEIGNNLYTSLVDSLLTFFKVQRCGYTNPLLHKTCHFYDVTSIIDGKDTLKEKKDVTGGWHDAGDYVKFFNTTAFSTYLLLFSYEYDKSKFGFDNDNSGVPDILEEAKTGLDWLQRCGYGDKFITQVQTLKDHDVGWRMPEDDILAVDRPGYIGQGKNLIGIYCATMALASRIWQEDIKYPDYAHKCITSAIKYYELAKKSADIDSSGSGMYHDNTFAGKMELGAVELYISTGDKDYLNDAFKYADSAKADYWWGWGNINSLAHYKLASYNFKYADYIKTNLQHFSNHQKNQLFEEGVPHIWGTNLTISGIVLQSILYKKLTGSNEFDTLEVSQRDFLLGKNQWGVSFFTGFGREYSQNLHNQVSYLTGKMLPGGFAAGPVTKKLYESYHVPVDEADRFSKFQTDSLVYYDNRLDYLTNEPTISANATAIFIFGVSE